MLLGSPWGSYSRSMVLGHRREPCKTGIPLQVKNTKKRTFILFLKIYFQKLSVETNLYERVEIWPDLKE